MATRIELLERLHQLVKQATTIAHQMDDLNIQLAECAKETDAIIVELDNYAEARTN